MLRKKRLNLSISAKMTAIIFIVLAAAMAFSLYFQVRLLKSIVVQHKVLRSQTIVSAVLSDIKINGYNRVNLQRLMYEFGREPDVEQVFIVNRNYQIIAASQNNKIGRLYRHGDMRQVFKESRTNWRFEKHRNPQGEVERIDTAAPIFIGGRLVGGLEVEISTNDLFAVYRDAIIKEMWLGIITLFLLFSALSKMISHLFISPLKQIVYGAEEVGAGNLNYRIKVKIRGEFEKVATAFNRMVESLSRQQQELKNMASRDSLTGLLNHRSFYEQLDKEIERSRRYDRLLSFCMIDVDYFKNFNDTYGHLEGDKALVTIADLLKTTFRAGDVIGRIGGEEFGVLLSQQDEQEAWEAAERLRRRVAAKTFIADVPRPSRMTISIGLASFPAQADTAAGLSKAADRALYQAKALGRNQVATAAGDEIKAS